MAKRNTRTSKQHQQHKTRDNEDTVEESASKSSPPTPELEPATRLELGLSWRITLTCLAGTFIFLSFATYNVWSLAYLGLVPLLVAIHDRTPRKAFWWGFLMGFVTNIGGFYWITGLLQDFGHLPWAVAALLCALCCAYQGLVFAIWAWLIRASQLIWPKIPLWAVAIPALLGLEFVLPMLFPWYLGNSQYIFYPAIQIADVFGVLGVSLSVLLVNLGLYAIVEYLFITPTEERRFPTAFVVVAFALYGASLLYGVQRIEQIDAEMAEAPTIRVGMVEGNIGIREKEKPVKLVNNILIHQNLSAQAAAEGAELIVWPESSYQSLFTWGSTLETQDRLLLELDSLFVPSFRDGILPAMRALELFGRPLHHIPATHRLLFTGAAYKAALAHGYKPTPPHFPGGIGREGEILLRCGEAFDTYMKCPFVRVPPDEVTFFLQGHEPLAPDTRVDREVMRTRVWNQRSVQRGFDSALIMGGLSMRPREGLDLNYMELHNAQKWDRELYNVAYLIDEEGRVQGNYKKVYLLLFGEKIPFSEHFPWIYELIPEAGSFTPGTELGIFEWKGARIGVLICYEDILPRYTNQLAPLKPQVLVNVTNDAWFGKTSEPYLHLQLAIFRSVELRTWMIRSTNTGVSAFIDANGRIRAETSLEDAEILVEDVNIMSGEPTLYSKIGDLLGWLGLLGLVGLWGGVIIVRRRIRRERSEEAAQSDEA